MNKRVQKAYPRVETPRAGQVGGAGAAFLCGESGQHGSPLRHSGVPLTGALGRRALGLPPRGLFLLPAPCGSVNPGANAPLSDAEHKLTAGCRNGDLALRGPNGEVLSEGT
jgi:hypothetical protein